MAPPVYDGRPVEEWHEHYNEAGELVGSTRVVRESPWDDAARDQAEALHEADLLVCPHCGNLREDCSDPTRPWYPQRNVCYASGALEVANWRYQERHKDAERTSRHPSLPTDGTTVWVSHADLTPDDDFI